MTSKKSNISIWKIQDFTASSMPSIKRIEKLMRDRNREIKQKNETYSFNKVAKIKSSVEGYESILYAQRRRNEGLYPFINERIEQNDEAKVDHSAIAKALKYTVVDTVFFIYNKKSIYAVTSSAAHYAIQDYVDDDFPMNIAIRIMNGQMQSSKSRSLSGATYSELKVYRSAYAISDSEAFGKIWKDLVGVIEKSTVESYPLISKMVKDRSSRIEIRGSFTFCRTLEIDQLFMLISELDDVTKIKLTDERQRIFSFTETAKPVKSKPQQDKLWNALLKTVRKDIIRGDPTAAFDVCHPTEPEKFLINSSANMTIGRDIFRFSDDETLGRLDYSSLIKALHETTLSKKMKFDDFEKIVNKVKVGFYYDTDEAEVKSDLIQYLHGEMHYDERTFFLIDTKWYYAPEQFLNKLSDFFRSDIQNGLLTKHIPFIKYPDKVKSKTGEKDYREGRFNEAQGRIKDFYYGDKISAQYKNAKIELFDLLWVSDSTTYVIQVKNDFANGIRDAASQIAMSARALNDRGEEREDMLKKYYSLWIKAKENNKTLTESEFLKLFDNKLIFVVASAHKYEFNEANLLDESKFQSHIAKFEIHQKRQEFRGSEWELRLARIEKSS